MTRCILDEPEPGNLKGGAKRDEADNTDKINLVNVPSVTGFSSPVSRGERLSVHGVQYLLNKHRMTASRVCPSLRDKQVTVHRLRHTTAMELLQGGVDRSVIALWLGHERVETTQIYLEATLAMKEKALAKTSPPHGRRGRYKPGDRLLAFLSDL